jgi:abequosyltransferase
VISICIPTYKRAYMLAELLESVVLQNIGSDVLEVVVSDDASPDDTLAVLATFSDRLPNLKIIKQPKNIGFDRNFLEVVAGASGEYVWILGDDDRLEPNSINLVINAIKQNPDIAGITLGSIDYDSQLINKTGLKQLPPTGLMHSAEEVFGKIGDLLGFMSTLVIHRATWNAVCAEAPVQDFFKLYVQVYIIGKVLQRKPLWLVFNTPCVHYRSDNDQFIKQLGWYDRLAADVEGYHAISVDLFGKNTAASRAFDAKIFNAHVRARLINGQTRGLASGSKLKVIKLLLAHYYWLPAFWLFALPILFIPQTAIISLRRFYQEKIPFSGTRRARKLSVKK